MDHQSGHVMTLANSIIGVSILAMPYCFKQCGVILSIVILLISSVISRLACHFLLKSAIIARRKTFEYLAFHIFGALGKLSIEIGIIGFLLGTCIAFFVVMGDLGPEIVSEITGYHTSDATRSGILIALAIFCVLPLGLLKNVDSLNGVSKATIGFYCCLVLKIMIEALPHIFSGDWLNNVILWRPKGILQCLPIFSMALFCQTQLFEIYQALPNPSLDKMNSMIRIAVNICTWVYIFVGAFGYIAFSQKGFAGNILLSFRPSIMSDMMKIGFVLSLAFSFPLVIFPCRASLYSLLYKGPSYTSLHEGTSNNYIPEGKFQALTLIIVLISLTLGVMIPNIELVLGLVGSTIGVMICVLFPVTCFICISPKNTNERILAQIMLFVGIIVMVLGTYANLYAFEEAKLNVVTEKSITNPKDAIKNVFDDILKQQPKLQQLDVIDLPATEIIAVSLELKAKVNKEREKNPKEIRHEPPQPVEPVESRPSPKPLEIKPPDVQLKDEPPENEVKDVVKLPVPKVEEKKELEEVKEEQGPVVEPVAPDESEKDKDKPKVEIKSEGDTEGEPLSNHKESDKKNDEVDIEAINKEDTELKEQEKDIKKGLDFQNQQLLESIKEQNKMQKEIVEQHKKLIEVIQNQQANVNFDGVKNNNDEIIQKVNEEKLKAVQRIESIARKAIESISGQERTKSNESNPKIEAKANPAPLSYQLGLNNYSNDMSSPKQNPKLLPLPMVLANKGAQVKNITKIEETEKANSSKTNNLTSQLHHGDVKFSPDHNVESHAENRVKRSVNKVCEGIEGVTSTEKPIIKMLCRLSEPALINIALDEKNGLDAVDGKSVNLKPQQTDSKLS